MMQPEVFLEPGPEPTPTHGHGVRIDQTYQRIRAHTRNNNTSLRTVAEAIVGVGLNV